MINCQDMSYHWLQYHSIMWLIKVNDVANYYIHIGRSAETQFTIVCPKLLLPSILDDF